MATKSKPKRDNAARQWAKVVLAANERAFGAAQGGGATPTPAAPHGPAITPSPTGVRVMATAVATAQANGATLTAAQVQAAAARQGLVLSLDEAQAIIDNPEVAASGGIDAAIAASQQQQGTGTGDGTQGTSPPTTAGLSPEVLEYMAMGQAQNIRYSENIRRYGQEYADRIWKQEMAGLGVSPAKEELLKAQADKYARQAAKDEATLEYTVRAAAAGATNAEITAELNKLKLEEAKNPKLAFEDAMSGIGKFVSSIRDAQEAGLGEEMAPFFSAWGQQLMSDIMGKTPQQAAKPQKVPVVPFAEDFGSPLTQSWYNPGAPEPVPQTPVAGGFDFSALAKAIGRGGGGGGITAYQRAQMELEREKMAREEALQREQLAQQRRLAAQQLGAEIAAQRQQGWAQGLPYELPIGTTTPPGFEYGGPAAAFAQYAGLSGYRPPRINASPAPSADQIMAWVRQAIEQFGG
jgi:hypothetical protein